MKFFSKHLERKKQSSVLFLHIPIIHPGLSYRYRAAHDAGIDETPRGNGISAARRQQSRRANMTIIGGSLLLFYPVGFLDNLLIITKMSDLGAAYFLFLGSYFI